MDALTNVLTAMKLSGSVFLEAEFTAPWCVSAQLGPADCAAYFPNPEHVISFHYVIQGEFRCKVGTGPAVLVQAGQILMLPHNDEHFLASDLSVVSVKTAELIQPPDEGPLAHISWGGGGESVKMLCGFLGTLTPMNAFLHSLPNMLVIDASSGATSEWLTSSLRYATQETLNGSPEMVGKLAELLFVEAIRQYVTQLPADQQGWLAGLRDPFVSRAMTLLHTRLTESWTTESLAREVGLSRSSLAERFSKMLGEPPMRYLASWRMNTAASLLREEQQNASNVAYAVGFNSEAAFSRAFKKEFGSPPATWRREKSSLK